MIRNHIQRAVLPALSSIVAAVSLAAGVLAAMPALAQDIQTADVRVDYSDLDLSKPADVRVLDRRLAVAIRVSCPNDARASNNLARQRPVIECRAQKRAEISAQRQAALAAAAGKQNMLAAR